MKISSSKLYFNSDRKYEESAITKREVEILDDQAPLSKREGNKKDGSSIRSGVRQFSSLRNRTSIKPQIFSAKIDVPKTSINDNETMSDPKLAAMKRILDAMMGKKIQLTDMSAVKEEQKINISDISTPPPAANRIRITEFNSYYESENTKFNAVGSIKTEDGESINFKLRLDMKREFYSENSSQIVGDNNLIDPLVVNFGGTAAELTDVKFKFDLNSDNKDDEISWLSSGSGFLVFDKNKDGIVNNGSEMFGPATNNGFSELEQLDDDKNGWIDENDAAFNNLSIWSGDRPDTAALKSLKESGIGAIAVNSQETEFAVKEQSSQNTLGQIRRTGIYLEENGRAGTIQQLDFAV